MKELNKRERVKPMKLLHMNSIYKLLLRFKFDNDDEDENISYNFIKNVNLSAQSTYWHTTFWNCCRKRFFECLEIYSELLKFIFSLNLQDPTLYLNWGIELFIGIFNIYSTIFVVAFSPNIFLGYLFLAYLCPYWYIAAISLI